MSVERLDVDVATPFALQPGGALGAQDVDPALEQAPAERDLVLLLARAPRSGS